MKRLIAALLLGGISITLQAAPRTFVASTGLDTNLCTRALPCKTFARALTQTDVAGEIVPLDSVGYGGLTINKSVSIVAPAGIYAGVTVTFGDAIMIDAPGAKVVLRGLDINGGGINTSSGIRVLNVGSLLVDRCSVSGFAGPFFPAPGIFVQGSGGRVTISNSIIRNNMGGGIVFDGLGATPESLIRGTVVGTLVENNGGGFGLPRDAGIAALSGALVTVKNSTAIGNFRGFSVCGNIDAPVASMSVEDSLSTRGVVGLFANSNIPGGVAATCDMRVSRTTVTDNTLFGIEQQNGSVVTSLGNNFIHNNAAAETFGATIPMK